MSEKTALAGTASTFVVAAAIQKAAPFVLLLVLARRLPVATFGQVSVLTAVFALSVAISGLGLESAAFRGVFVSRTPASLKQYYSALAKVTVLGPLAVALVLTAVIVISDQPFGIPGLRLVAVILGGCLFAAATTLPLAKLRAEGAVRWYVVCSLIPTFVQVLTKLVLCVGYDLGADGWVLGDLVAGTVAFVLTLRIQYRYLLTWPVSLSVTSEVLRLGLPLLPHVISSWVLSLSDRLIVAGLVSFTAAGQYGLVSQLSSVGMILTTELNRALAPEYGHVINREPASEENLRRLISTQRLMSIPIFTLTAAGSVAFVLGFAPSEYHEGVGWIVVLCAGFMLYSWYYPPMNILSISEGRTALMPAITVSAAIVNVSVNLLLVRHHGPAVAAYSTVLGYAILLLLTSVYAGRRPALHWSWRASLGCAMAFGGFLAVGSAIIL